MEKSIPVEVRSCAILLVLCICLSLPGIFSRSIWYDESISLMITSGHTSPAWPKEPVPATEVQQIFSGTTTLRHISMDLRQTDIHPPLYFWALSIWRQTFGESIAIARCLSLLFFLLTIFPAYWILRSIGIKHPFCLMVLYVTSYHTIYMSGETRPYALANLFLITGMACSYAATTFQFKSIISKRICQLAVPPVLAMAFLTNYLTIFSGAAILVWQMLISIRTGHGKRFMSLIGSPAAAILICLAWVPALMSHTGARPDQASGQIGAYAEITKMFWLNLFNIFYLPESLLTGQGISVSVILLILMVLPMISLTLITIVRHLHSPKFEAALLLLLSTVATSAGIILLDFLFDKNLAATRYLFFGLFPTIILIYYGLDRGKLIKLFYAAAALSVLIQFGGIYWSNGRAYAHDGSYSRSLAHQIRKSRCPSRIVAIMAGNGRGIPASVIYELPGQETVLVVNKENATAGTIEVLKRYNEIWVALSFDDPQFMPLQKGLIGTILKDKKWRIAESHSGFLCLRGRTPISS